MWTVQVDSIVTTNVGFGFREDSLYILMCYVFLRTDYAVWEYLNDGSQGIWELIGLQTGW